MNNKLLNENKIKYSFLENVIKMQVIDPNIQLSQKTQFNCLICNGHYNYSGKYLLSRYKKYNAVGCPKCLSYQSKEAYLSDIEDKLKEYEIILLDKNSSNITKELITLRRYECNHVFTTKLYNMLYGGVMCPECDIIRKKDQLGIFQDGIKIKKESYSVDEVLKLFEHKLNCTENPIRFKNINLYKRMDAPMTFICGKCNKEWDTRPANILHLNSGCPYCAKNNYSKISIKWLNMIMENEGIFIQHAENIGEKCVIIDGKRYFVDGYCEETNTIYEFHGSYYHGDPKLFHPNDHPHPFKKEFTAKELYDKTIQKEEILRNNGYRIVTMWESDFES